MLSSKPAELRAIPTCWVCLYHMSFCTSLFCQYLIILERLQSNTFNIHVHSSISSNVTRKNCLNHNSNAAEFVMGSNCTNKIWHFKKKSERKLNIRRTFFATAWSMAESTKPASTHEDIAPRSTSHILGKWDPVLSQFSFPLWKYCLVSLALDIFKTIAVLLKHTKRFSQSNRISCKKEITYFSQLYS